MSSPLPTPKRLIGLAIKEAAEQRNITLVQLAVASQVPYGTLEPLWYKRRFNATATTLSQLAQVLNVSVDSLFVYADSH